MKYNKSKIMKRAWFLKKSLNISLSIALKQSWLEAKSNISFSDSYKECLPVIKNICKNFSLYYKLNYEDIFSEANEAFTYIYNKYDSTKQVKFFSYFYGQIKFYINNYCKNEKIRKEKEYHIEMPVPSKQIEQVNTPKLSKLTKKIIDYCVKENTKKSFYIQKIKVKGKVYEYKRDQLKIHKKQISSYFKKIGYGWKEIEDSFQEIKFLLKNQLI